MVVIAPFALALPCPTIVVGVASLGGGAPAAPFGPCAVVAALLLLLLLLGWVVGKGIGSGGAAAVVVVMA